jgi:hypothetical protein
MKLSVFIMPIFFASAVFGAQTRNDAVVLPLGAASQLLIPVAGSTPGANGTFFRSDIAIINFAGRDQMVKLQWVPQSGGTGSTSTITIALHSGIRSADFVTRYLNQSGLGSILVSGVQSDGVTPDLNAQLYISTRVWTPQPGTSGTTSQSLPAIPMSAVNTQVAALFAVGGADNQANYRVNVGIVNLDPTNAQTFQISLPSSVGPQLPAIQVTIAPMSMQQVGVGNGLPPSQEVLIQNVTGGTTQSNSWIAYGSTVDNVTGDAWSELAVAGTSAQ